MLMLMHTPWLVRRNYWRDVAMVLVIAASVVIMSAPSDATNTKVRLSHIDLTSIITHGPNSELACPTQKCEYFGEFFIEKASWVACGKTKQFLGEKGCQFADAAFGHATTVAIVTTLIQDDDGDTKVLKGEATEEQIKNALENCCVQKGQHIVDVDDCGPAYAVHNVTIEVTGYALDGQGGSVLYLIGTVTIKGAHEPFTIEEFCVHEVIQTELDCTYIDSNLDGQHDGCSSVN